VLMETVTTTEDRMEDLKGRIDDLEQQKTSLENEISALVEQIPILEMSRYASLLESNTSSLRLVRDMLQVLSQDRLGAASEAAAPSIPSN
jgi:predicted  nucleic acid-binding Zn-ribbon protein